MMRLQRYLARSGVASRRGSEDLIAQGHVCVNGELVTAMGTTVDEMHDEVTVDGRLVAPLEQDVTIMLHKPAGYVSTMRDPQGRPTVADLVPIDTYPSLYPIGRLDAATTGLLLFSTDGSLGDLLLHPRHHVSKRYVALIEGLLDSSDVQALQEGIELEDGLTLPAKIEILVGEQAHQAACLVGGGEASDGATARDGDKGFGVLSEPQDSLTYAAVELCEGRKRQVRRMFEALGHPVVALHRESLGSVVLGDLPCGSWRELCDEEVVSLRGSVSDATYGM